MKKYFLNVNIFIKYILKEIQTFFDTIEPFNTHNMCQ